MNMTRRTSLCALGSAAVAPQAILAQTIKGKSPRFAVRSPLPGEEFSDRVRLAAEVGFDGVEIGGGDWLQPRADRILSDFKTSGLQISAVSALQKHLDLDPAVRQESIEENRRRLRKAKQLGATAMVVVPVFGPNKFPDLAPLLSPREIETKLLVHALKHLAPTAEETGIKIAIEPLNRKETHFINRLEQALEICKLVGSPAVTILSDFYHMQLEEADIPKAVERCVERISYVHVADGVKRTVPGSLPFDYRPGFAVLKRHGYAGWITIEARPSGDPRQALKSALAYLKQQWRQA